MKKPLLIALIYLLSSSIASYCADEQKFDQLELPDPAEESSWTLRNLCCFLSGSESDYSHLPPRKTAKVYDLKQVLDSIASNPLRRGERAGFLVGGGHKYAVHATGLGIKHGHSLIVSDVAQSDGLNQWLKLQPELQEPTKSCCSCLSFSSSKGSNIRSPLGKIEIYFMLPINTFYKSNNDDCKYYLAKDKNTRGYIKHWQPVLQEAMNGCDGRSREKIAILNKDEYDVRAYAVNFCGEFTIIDQDYSTDAFQSGFRSMIPWFDLQNAMEARNIDEDTLKSVLMLPYPKEFSGLSDNNMSSDNFIDAPSLSDDRFNYWLNHEPGIEKARDDNAPQCVLM